MNIDGLKSFFTINDKKEAFKGAAALLGVLILMSAISALF